MRIKQVQKVANYLKKLFKLTQLNQLAYLIKMDH